MPSLQHILTGSKSASTQGSYRWRHNQVLHKLTGVLEEHRFEANKTSHPMCKYTLSDKEHRQKKLQPEAVANAEAWMWLAGESRSEPAAQISHQNPCIIPTAWHCSVVRIGQDSNHSRTYSAMGRVVQQACCSIQRLLLSVHYMYRTYGRIEMLFLSHLGNKKGLKKSQ